MSTAKPRCVREAAQSLEGTVFPSQPTHMQEALADDLLADVAHPDWPGPPWVLAESLDDQRGQDQDCHQRLHKEGGRAEQSARRAINWRDGDVSLLVFQQIGNEVLHRCELRTPPADCAGLAGKHAGRVKSTAQSATCCCDGAGQCHRSNFMLFGRWLVELMLTATHHGLLASNGQVLEILRLSRFTTLPLI